MRDTELYRHLLGLVAPWEVSQVELLVEDGRVDVWVEHPGRTRLACADCERELSAYDHCEERSWRHLDSCAFLTFLHAGPPRVGLHGHHPHQTVVVLLHEGQAESSRHAGGSTWRDQPHNDSRPTSAATVSPRPSSPRTDTSPRHHPPPHAVWKHRLPLLWRPTKDAWRYWPWTAKIDGKAGIRRLSDTEVELYQEPIANDRQLRAITAQMRKVAAKAIEPIGNEATSMEPKVESQAHPHHATPPPRIGELELPALVQRAQQVLVKARRAGLLAYVLVRLT